MSSFDKLYAEIMEEGLRSSIAGAALGAATLLSPIDAIGDQQPARTSSVQSQSIYDTIVSDLIRHEGDESYQKAKGMFKNGKFFTYVDTRGHDTIGYGHKILPGEDFSQGITKQEARDILSRDMRSAWNGAHRLMSKHGVVPYNEVRRAIVNMVFQMGERGVSKFPSMWKALSNRDYDTAADEILDSKYARSDSPGRAIETSSYVRSLSK